MGTCILHEGSLPGGFSSDFEPALFNSNEFLSLGDSTPALQYNLLDDRRNKATATIFFQLDGRIAKSPLKAPFGSLEYSEAVTPRQVYEFLEFIESELRKRNIEEVYIKNPPRSYSPQQLAVLETIFFNRGYVLSDAEVGAVITVTKSSSIEGMRSAQVLRSRQASHAGLLFEETPLEDFDSVFNFISDCHKKKGYHLSVSDRHLRKAIDQFYGRYVLFSIRHKEKIVAASISVRVKKNILYNFLVNHDEEYNHLSPPVLLIEGTYEYCRKNNIGLFDLGTSALHGLPNFPLLDFKLRMGGLPTSKFTFYKKMN